MPFFFFLSGAILEQNLLLNRKNEATNEYFVNYRDLVTNSSIYVCTTMYHEEAFEMEQLLNSISSLDNARREAGRNMEAHIFFDDGVRDRTLKKYALQLVSLLERTLDVQASTATKIATPYGMQLKWKLPGGMMFYIHLKDNFKVNLSCLIWYYCLKLTVHQIIWVVFYFSSPVNSFLHQVLSSHIFDQGWIGMCHIAVPCFS